MSFKVVKFYLGSTAQKIEKKLLEELELPDVTICTKTGTNYEALAKYGLRRDFLRPHPKIYSENFELPNIDEIWENSTLSPQQFTVLSHTDEGNGIAPVTLQIYPFYISLHNQI